MTDYVKSTNFASKDSLATGNPLKIVKGTEIDTEFNNIATAVATKADLNSPALIGTPTAPTASAGNNTTLLATTAFTQTAVTNGITTERTAAATLTNKTLTSPTISGGTVSGITDLAIADGGTGASTAEGARTNLGLDPYTGSSADNLTFPIGSYLPVQNNTGVYNKYNNSTFTVYRGNDAGAYVYTDSSSYSGATALTGTWAVRGSTNSASLRSNTSGATFIYLMQRIA